MRLRLGAGQGSTVYSPGQFVSAAYAFRYPHKVEMEPVTRGERRMVRDLVKAKKPRPRKRPEPAPPKMVRVVPVEKPEQWEVTISYSGMKRIEDITVRMVARSSGKWTPAQVKKAFWAAHKLGASALREWTLDAVDWRGWMYPTAKASVDEAIENLGGIVNTVGMKALRVARVEA